MFGKNEPRKDRFRVISKIPGDLLYAPNSALSPTLPDPDKVFRVRLRFEPRREYHHPDDNDLLLSCSPELYDRLQDGMYGEGTWQKKTLLDFEPISE